MLRSVSDVVKAFVAVLILGSLVTYATVTRITVYRNTTELELLKDQFNAHVALHKDSDAAMGDRLTSLEKVVLTAPTDVRKPVALEQWIINADNEMRKRIKALEEWRLKKGE